MVHPDPVECFVSELRLLTRAKLVEVATRVESSRATPGDTVDWWVATSAVSRDLKRAHRQRTATLAYRRASEAVLAVPGADDLPHDRVVHAARAAGDVARALVAGRSPGAMPVLTRGWEEFLPSADEQPVGVASVG
jgi:hypothetical protein